MKVRTLLTIIICFVGNAYSLGQIVDNTYINEKLGLSIKVECDSIFFYNEGNNNFTKTTIVAKGSLNQLSPNLYQIHQQSVVKKPYDSFVITDVGASINDTLDLTLIFPGLKESKQNLVAIINQDYDTRIKDGIATFKIPFNKKKTYYIGLSGNRSNDKIGNSYYPILVYCDKEFKFDKTNKKISFPNVTEENLQLFDVDGNYIEFISPNTIKWKGYCFKRTGIDNDSEISTHAKQKRAKKGYYFIPYYFPGDDGVYNLVDFINSANEYELSFVLNGDEIELYADRDWVVDGSVYNFLYSQNLIGKGKLKPIGNNYYEVDVEPFSEKILKDMSINYRSCNDRIETDSVNLVISFPDFYTNQWYSYKDSLSITVQYTDKEQSKRVLPDHPECLFRIPTGTDSICLIIKPYESTKPKEHIKNIYPHDFLKFEFILPKDDNEINLSFKNLSYNSNETPIDFRGEYFEVLTPTKIKWRDKIFELSKKGSKIYNKFKKGQLSEQKFLKH